MNSALPSYLTGPVETRVERFFLHWLGPTTAEAEPVRATPGIAFPDVVQRHHQTRSRWAVPLERVCRLLHPSEVGTSDVRPPELTLFLEEAQGVQEWGFDSEHHVWTREVEAGKPWVSTGADLASFLVGYELAEAAMGAPGSIRASCAWMSRERIQAVVEPLVALPVPPFMVGFAPHRLYGNDDALALVGPNPFGDETPETATAWEVWVSGRVPGALDWLADIEGACSGNGWESRAQLAAYDGIVWDVLRLV